MARATLTITDLTMNDGTAGTGGTIVAADGALVAAGGKARNLILRATAGTIAGTLTIKAGDNPPGFRSGLGDLSVALAANQIKLIVIESARFSQDNGDIHIDSAGELVVMTPFRLPAGL